MAYGLAGCPRAYGLVMALNGIVIVLDQPLAGRRPGRRDHSLLASTAALGQLALAPAIRSRTQPDHAK